MTLEEENLAHMTEEFARFLKDGKYSSDEIREAYYRLCGVSENESADAGNMEKIVSMMSEMTDNGYPLNRIADIIGTKQAVERAVPNFYEFLNTLEISDSEKKVLSSIVDKGRSGEIDFFVDSKLFGSLAINIGKVPKEITAIAIKEGITRVLRMVPKGKKYKFSFTEK